MTSGRYKEKWVFIAGLVTILLIGSWVLLQPYTAADFELTDMEGNVFKLSDFTGRVVVLDFMATWCLPCKSFTTVLKALQEEFKENVVIISITIIPEIDTDQIMKRWVEGLQLEWIHARDLAEPPVSRIFRITEIPTIVIIDQNGALRFRHSGLIDIEILREKISQLLKE